MLRGLLALAALALISGGSSEASASDIGVESAWARATPGGAKVAAGYLTIKNAGAAADVLTGVASAVAGAIEVHEMKDEDGVMKMRAVTEIDVPAGGSVELKPGGLHLMLVDLKQPLKEGERFKATLTFKTAGAVEVDFAVGGVGAAAPPAGAPAGGGHEHHQH